MKAIIYAARSKDEEPGKDSTGSQVAAIRKALPKDRKVVGDAYIDHASGFSSDRGRGLEAAIEAAIAASPCELWVFHSSRLGRGTGKKGEARAIGKLLYDLMAEDVTVRSVEDNEFTTNEMLWGITSTQASKYSRDLSAHVRRGQREAFEEGRWPGARHVPDGYTLGPPREDKKGRGLVIDEPRAAVIRRMADLALEGTGYRSIARRLNDEGYRTKQGYPWREPRVRDTLSNPVYAGRVVWHRREPDEEIRKGLHEHIIEPELFDALGVKMSLRNRGKTGGRPAPAAALSGIAVCDACGQRMESRRSGHVRKDGSRQTVYLCASRRYNTGTCDAPRVDGDKVDRAIMARLTAWTTDWETWKAEQVRALDRERAALEVELASHGKDLAQRTKERDRMRKRFIERQTDAAEEALAECRRLVEQAEARVAETQQRLDAYPTEPDTDALLDVHARFSAIATDPKTTVNAKAKLLLKEVRIFTHPGGDVTLHCVGREDVVTPPLRPDTKPGVGDVPEGYHVIPTQQAQRALLTSDLNAWA